MDRGRGKREATARDKESECLRETEIATAMRSDPKREKERERQRQGQRWRIERDRRE